MTKNLFTVLAIFICVTLTGCITSAPKQEITEEERQQMNALRQAMIQRLTQTTTAQNQQYLVTNKLTKQAEIVSLSEDELLNQYNDLISTGNSAIFERKKDGIIINGKMFLDPEGEIVTYGSDTISGKFTYVIKNFDGSYALKAHRAGSDSEPLTIATIYQQGGNQTVETVSGKKLKGNTIIPTTNGVLVSRGNSVFQYEIGSNIKSVSILDNYHVAQLQKGDVASTGYILLEKNPESQNSIGGLVSNLSSVGRTFGLTKKFDYALLNIKDGSLVPLNVDLNGKEVTSYSQCRKKNSMVNTCDKVNYSESLFDRSGSKNWGHYYWVADWVNTTSGPIAIYRTATELLVIDIKNKEVHQIVTRTMGVNDHEVNQGLDGKVSLDVTLGFNKKHVDDVEDYIIQRKSQKIDILDELEI